jgi:hypothetical protein
MGWSRIRKIPRLTRVTNKVAKNRHGQKSSNGGAPNSELSKMFGTPFGLSLDNKEVDAFFIKKIHKKLKFWNMVHLPIVCQAVIVNFVLASTLWFFINI